MDADDLPRDASDATVKQLITVHEAATEHLDGEISALRQQIRRLEFNKTQHALQIHRLRGRITLARRLPHEILARIFQICACAGWTRTPLTASHVCSDWRNAASTPSIWSYLYVNLDAMDPVGRTAHWLDKVKAGPLHIHLDIKNDVLHLHQVMCMLTPLASQWRSLRITSILLEPVNTVLSQRYSGSFMDLRSIDISTQEDFPNLPGVESHLLGLTEAFINAPILKTIQISRNVIPGRGDIPPSITELILNIKTHSLNISTLLDLLEDLPLLEKLSLTTPPQDAFSERENTITTRTGDESRQVELLNLTSLTIITYPLAFLLLGYLYLPSLRRISLRSSLDALPYPHTSVGTSLHRLIQQADIPLEALDLHDLDLSASHFVACARHMPCLRELRLHESDISDTTLHAINELCPRLERLDLRWCGMITGHALVELAQNRLDASADATTPVKALESVTVINCSYIDEKRIFELAKITVCRLVASSEDYCVPFGCCLNERYRKRFELRQLEQGFGLGTKGIVIS